MAAGLLNPQASRRYLNPGSHNGLRVDTRHTRPSRADGYDYKNVGRSPQRMNTELSSRPPAPKSNPRLGITSTAATQDAFQDLPEIESPENQNDEAIYKIGWKPAGSRRARVPDLEKGTSNEAPTATDGPKTPYQAGHRSMGVPSEGNVSEAHADADVKYIKLGWTLAHKEAKREFVLNVAAPVIGAQDADLQRRVLWRHSEHEVMRLDKLEDCVNKCRFRGLSEGEIGLTRRLLLRVRTLAEYPFVGGNYLAPITSRYDNQDTSKYTVNKTCIFFNFPYFALADTGMRKHFRKASQDHPPRTLLQSHYRLNKTNNRDSNQCIKLLKSHIIKSSIEASEQEKNKLSKEVTEEMIYVPQLWGLIVGLDTMITCGPIGDEALRGSAIKTTEDETPSDASKLSLVRILFTYKDQLEDLIYPVDQCNSFFGLMNKQQQILEYIKEGDEKPRPMDYPIKIDEETITIQNWASVLQRSRFSETLDLWMKKDIPEIPFQSTQGREHAADSSVSADSTVNSPETPASLGIVTPFLAWPVLDEFGEPDELSLSDRVDKFLRAIFIALPTGNVMSTQERAMLPKLATAQRIGAKTRISIVAQNSDTIRNHLAGLSLEKSESNDSHLFASEVFEQFETIIALFLPEPYKADSDPIGLYWGAVYEIIREISAPSFPKSNFTTYLATLSQIVSNAKRLHQGVHCIHYEEDPATKELQQKDAISQGAILLAVMVDALGAVFHMLVETLRCLRRHEFEIGDIMAPENLILKYGTEACDLLETARDQLVREANGTANNNSIGPVVTPEAITIALFDRLTSGVFFTGSIDVINLYEECLEHLAMKVEHEASRRLLHKINAFEEEVSIVNEVLKQQANVLLHLKLVLDPATFKTPSIARSLRYRYESEGIDTILLTIKEKRRNCAELRDRAKSLAHQNVQLVETLQDDNSKAIFIFTMVTIIFLPLTFVAGYFGMNLNGISNSDSTTRHFWVIAVPVTVGIVLLCSVVAFKGEDVFFAFAGFPRRLKGVHADPE